MKKIVFECDSCNLELVTQNPTGGIPVNWMREDFTGMDLCFTCTECVMKEGILEKHKKEIRNEIVTLCVSQPLLQKYSILTGGEQE